MSTSDQRTAISKIFFFKEENERYNIVFQNHTIEYIPLLSFRAKNTEQLAQNLLNPAQYKGLVVSSKTAVDQILSLLQTKKIAVQDLQPWATDSKALFCVGEQTQRALFGALGISQMQSSAPCYCASKAVDLTGMMNEWQLNNNRDDPDSRPLLFLCGNIRRDEIPIFLAQSKIPFEELVIYETLPADLFKSKFSQLDFPDQCCLVFFSPSGVETFVSNIPNLKDPRLFRSLTESHRLHLSCLGPTTGAQIVQSFSQSPCIQAEKPNPESLLEAIELHFQQGNNH